MCRPDACGSKIAAWGILVICGALFGFWWAVAPSWEELLNAQWTLEDESQAGPAFLVFGWILLTGLAIGLWRVLPGGLRHSWDWIKWFVDEIVQESARQTELERIFAELRKQEAELRSQAAVLEHEAGTTIPMSEWPEVSEELKDAILDQRSGQPHCEAPWPATLPPAEPGVLDQRIRDQVDQTLARLLNMMNESPTGDVPRESQPHMRQLFDDLEHDLVELSRSSRVEAAYAQLPPPQGHWAECYRRMKKEAALHPSEPQA